MQGSFRSQDQSARQLLQVDHRLSHLKSMTQEDRDMFEGGEQENEKLPSQTALLTFTEGHDPEVTLESIHNLGQRVKQCAKHLQYGKLLI